MGKPIGKHRALGREMERILPAAAIDRYRDLVGGLLGDNLDDVIRFALISFLHDRAETLKHFERVPGEFIVEPPRKLRAVSSIGPEHSPRKRGDAGSTPVRPSTSRMP